MKKKFLALATALTLALSLAACGSGSGTTAPSQGSADPIGGSETAGSVQEGTASNGGSETAGSPQENVDLTAFYGALLEENEWPDLMALEGEALDGFYPGLSDLSLKQCLVNTAAISAAVGEIALVETETEEDAQTAADIFQARIDYQVGDETNPGGAWYPMTIEGWQNNSHIAIRGHYVMLAVGDHAGEAVDRFNEQFA